MNDKPQEMPPVPPFVRFVASAVPMVFDNSLSYYEALCALWKYIQDMTDVVNNNATLEEEYIEKFAELKSFVDNYFDNLDVQEEINNKLDDMVEDGTLQNLLSEVTLNSSFFFMAGFDMLNANKTRYFVSGDGVNFNEIEISKNFGGRDISLVYRKQNKTFYVTYTTSDSSSSIKIWTSEDLDTWEEHTCSIDGLYTTGKTWAPDLFVDDNGDIYVTISSQYATEADISGQTIPAFDIFIAKCNDVEDLTFDTAYKVDLSDSSARNHIDSNIIKVNNTYYLDVKNEYNKKTEIFSSTDLSTFTILTENLTGSSMWVEGNQLVSYQDKILYIADAYNDGCFISSSTDVNDFPTFKNKFNICEGLKTGDIRIRHGSIIYIDDFNAKTKIWNRNGFYLGKSSVSNNLNFRKYVNTNTQSYLLTDYSPLPNSYLNLAGTNNANVTIKNIFNVSEFKFCFGASDGVTLTLSKIDDVTLNNPIQIVNNRSINEKIQTIELTAPSFSRYLHADIQGLILDEDDITYDSTKFDIRNTTLIRLNGTTWFHTEVKRKSDYAGIGWETLITLPSGYRPYIPTLLNSDNPNHDPKTQINGLGLLHINSKTIPTDSYITFTGCWIGMK